MSTGQRLQMSSSVSDHVPHLWVYVNPAYTQTIFYTQTNLIFETLEKVGATVLVGDAFAPDVVTPKRGDQLITYGNADNRADLISRFPPKSRWLYIVDESSVKTGIYDTAISYMKRLHVTHTVVTYQNTEHLAKLTAAGIDYVVVPQCMPTIRPRTTKTKDVLISGQLDVKFYPVRTQVANALSRFLPQHTDMLLYPGSDIPETRHDIYHDRYYQHLEQFQMGVTCRAGYRDRFVAKYVEMGACHVLPVGDCPTYMPDAMQRAMVNVADMKLSDIAAEVERLLLAPDELQARTDAFTAECERHYMVLPNVERAVADILRRGQQLSG